MRPILESSPPRIRSTGSGNAISDAIPNPRMQTDTSGVAIHSITSCRVTDCHEANMTLKLDGRRLGIFTFSRFRYGEVQEITRLTLTIII